MTDLLEKILKNQERMNSKLSELMRNSDKKTWISVRFIQDLTGWDGIKLFEARKQKIIEYRKNKNGGYEYLLESIPDQFLIKVNQHEQPI